MDGKRVSLVLEHLASMQLGYVIPWVFDSEERRSVYLIEQRRRAHVSNHFCHTSVYFQVI